MHSVFPTYRATGADMVRFGCGASVVPMWLRRAFPVLVALCSSFGRSVLLLDALLSHDCLVKCTSGLDS